MDFKVEKNGIFCRSGENGSWLYMSLLSSIIEKKAKLTIEAWKLDFGEELLNPCETDWLDDSWGWDDSDIPIPEEFEDSEQNCEDITRKYFLTLCLNELSEYSYSEIYSD
jgi:hypothetical protein